MKVKNIFDVFIIFLLFLATTSSQIKGQCTPYLGQTVPINIAKRFPPSSFLPNASWWWQSSPIFSPDGNEMYFVKYILSTELHEIWFTKCTNLKWSAAEKASFSIGAYNANPLFLKSNDTLYFYSERPEGFIFYVTRNSSGWSEPIALDIPIPENKRGYYFSLSDNKNAYFSMLDETVSSNNIWETADIYVSKFINGKYDYPEKLGTSINSEIGEFVGYIEPNEKFLILSSTNSNGFGGNDMYLCNRKSDGTWDTPINLGSKINSTNDDLYPAISSDGMYFFYVTFKNGDYGYTPYWIKADVIYDLVTNVDEELGNNMPSMFKLMQNYPNPFNPNTIIEYSIPRNESVSLKVYDIVGNVVEVLVNENQKTGYYETKFNAKNLSSGVYFCQFIAGNYKETRKMNLIK